VKVSYNLYIELKGNCDVEKANWKSNNY